jgi:ribosomal protein S27E
MAASLTARILWSVPGVQRERRVTITKQIRKDKIMRHRKGNLARATIAGASSTAKRRVTYHLALAERIRSDSEKKDRIEACLCKACHYFSQLGGAAITNRECAGCGKDQTFGSTATDALCLDCANTHSLCKRCGGDREMRVKRNTWPDMSETSSN